MNDEDWSWILGDGEDIEDALEHYVNLAQDWDEWSARRSIGAPVQGETP